MYYTYETSSASATFEYKNPCREAKIIVTPHDSIKVQVNSSATSIKKLWYAEITDYSTSPSIQVPTTLCGQLSVSKSLMVTPITFVKETMSSDFIETRDATHTTLTISPTKQQEIGDYAYFF